RWRAAGHDQIDVEPAQLGGETRVAASAALCRAILDEQVLTLGITELPQPLSKFIDVRRVVGQGHRLEHADAVDPPGLLLLRGERRSYDRERACHEGPSGSHQTTIPLGPSGRRALHGSLPDACRSHRRHVSLRPYG